MVGEELCLPETFSGINYYKNNCRHITIGYKIRDNRKSSNLCKDFLQFENMQNYKDLYGKALKHDWRAKQFLPLQILLIPTVNKNPLFKDICLKIYMSAFYQIVFHF